MVEPSDVTAEIDCDHSKEEIKVGTHLGVCRVCGFIVPLSSPTADGVPGNLVAASYEPETAIFVNGTPIPKREPPPTLDMGIQIIDF